ncbi:MAG: hypothetical protein M9925_10485 [Chloroflexi bacterium]|nr:hypothetical protein [Chloroflexota bacterium]MCZ7577488.1 hypothetical protein [Dehalococcoidia bacterium]
MGVRLTSPAGRRRASWILVLALLPTLTFFGHWPEQISLPGTGYYLAIPGSSPVAPDGTANGGHDHSSHCHADAATCSDVPATAGVSFAILNETVALFGAGGLFVLLALRWWVPGEGFTPSPELEPPRALAHA